LLLVELTGAFIHLSLFLSLQEKLRVALLVSQAALQFIHGVYYFTIFVQSSHGLFIDFTLVHSAQVYHTAHLRKSKMLGLKFVLMSWDPL